MRAGQGVPILSRSQRSRSCIVIEEDKPVSKPTDDEKLRETVLHPWHQSNGARLVPFSGWSMPVNYSEGIISEHLATRRNAGLFDVSHMGRFRIRGADAVRFLSHALTNDAADLAPGHAHYTFLADPDGHPLDDAYLYCLAPDDFLLVVNAGNRSADWTWLTRLCSQAGPAGPLANFAVVLEDQTDEIAMLALQGPNAGNILSAVTGGAALPEPKRNLHQPVRFQEGMILAARTGYTGEGQCFEIFPPRGLATPLWSALIGAGASPVGLGARDSLRLEAGLPLYGHELGPDPSGNIIPIFANPLATFGVRADPTSSFVGSTALHQQRAARRTIIQGHSSPSACAILPRLVRQIAVFGGRRPLRAGYTVFHEDREVGVVTSGTIAPFAHRDQEGNRVDPNESPRLRPIGMALIDAELGYRADPPTRITVHDTRGTIHEAEIVKRNLIPDSPA